MAKKRKTHPSSNLVKEVINTSGEEIKEGTPVVLEQPEDLSKKIGFVDYPKDHIIQPVEPEPDVTYLVATTNVNFRLAPNGSVLTVAKKDDKFLLLANLGEWSKVQSSYDNTIGYIKSEFLKEV